MSNKAYDTELDSNSSKNDQKTTPIRHFDPSGNLLITNR